MGTKLRRLIKEYKGKKLEDGKGLCGKGRLTISHIDALQSFYGHTIRKNKGNVKKCRRKYGLFSSLLKRNRKTHAF